MPISITPKDLLDAGVHFGHQTKRWNPRSKPYVFDHRQGITIIDLGKTHELLAKAAAFLEETVAAGGQVLLVGTKKQARDIIREAASTTNMPWCVDRWLGGTLTNFRTIRERVRRLFYGEIEALRRLSHPNIVGLLGFHDGGAAGPLAVVLELVDASLDHVADGHQADELVLVDHRQVADALVGHGRHHLLERGRRQFMAWTVEMYSRIVHDTIERSCFVDHCPK